MAGQWCVTGLRLVWLRSGQPTVHQQLHDPVFVCLFWREMRVAMMATKMEELGEFCGWRDGGKTPRREGSL